VHDHVAVIDIQPGVVHVVEGDILQFNCSVTSSGDDTCPVSALNLSSVVVRNSSQVAYGGRVQLMGDDVAQVTLDTRARFSDEGNVYCSLADVTGNTIVQSEQLTHIYVYSQYI